MAGAGYKLFNTGDVLTAAQVNTYLMQQTVMVFANATARTTALSGVLAEGMVSYLQDTNATEVYDGSAWVGIGNSGDITGVTAGTGISGGGTSGTVTITNSMATEITAAGDIIVGTGSGTFDNLPIGTTGQVLTADTTVSPYKVKWATASSSPSFVGCRAYRATSNVSVNNNTWTAIAFNAESWDTDGFHDNTTNNSRITIPTGKGGYYFLSASVNAEAQGTTTTSYVDIWVNGSGGGISIPISIGWQNPTNSDSTRKTSGTIKLNAGDYFEVMYLQDSGSAKNYKADIAGTFVDIHYLGA